MNATFRSGRSIALLLLLQMAGGFVVNFVLLAARVIVAFGMAAFSLRLVTVTLPLFGAPIFFPLLAPAGLAHLALAVCLLTRGLAAPAPFARVAADA